MNNFDPKTDCCPPFAKEPWDEKTFEWNNKQFIKDKVCTLFNVPMNFGKVITRMNNAVEKAGAKTPNWLCLSDHTSKWNMDIYLAVDKEIPGAHNVTLGGKFVSKVYEGNFKNTGKWCADFEQYAKAQNYNEIKKMYMWYTTCPKCAKKYGQNNVVIIGQVG